MPPLAATFGVLPEKGAQFPSTHWTVVLKAGNNSSEAHEAMSNLCSAYWFPLYAFIRRRGYSAEEAEDLTQEFFIQIINGQLLCRLQKEGGKFRSYLLTALKAFLANQWHRQHAQKRGGGRQFVPIDETAEARYQAAASELTMPEIEFDKQWAFTLLNRVLGAVRKDYEDRGSGNLLDHLKSFLPGSETPASYEQTAKTLHMTETAVRMAVHRLRKTYGRLLREEIAQTISGPEQIDEEIRALIQVLSAERS